MKVNFFAPNPEEVFNRLGQLHIVAIYPFAVTGEVCATIIEVAWLNGSAEDAAVIAVCDRFGTQLEAARTYQHDGQTWVTGFVPTVRPESTNDWLPVRMLGGQVPPEIARILIKLI